jgi:hypothetical protein
LKAQFRKFVRGLGLRRGILSRAFALLFLFVDLFAAASPVAEQRMYHGKKVE